MPKKDVIKDVAVIARMRPQEKAELVELASAAGFTVTDVVQEALKRYRPTLLKRAAERQGQPALA